MMHMSVCIDVCSTLFTTRFDPTRESSSGEVEVRQLEASDKRKKKNSQVHMH
jgi:hypothetical protein